MKTERYFYIHRNKTKVPLVAVDGESCFYLDQNTPIDSATERMLTYYIYDARDIGKAAKYIVDLTKSQTGEHTNKVLSDFKEAHPVTKTSDNEVNLVPFCSSLEGGMKLFVSNCSHVITRDDEIKLLDIVFKVKSKGAENALTEWFDKYREENGVNFNLNPKINQSRELAKSFLQQHGVFYDKRTSAFGFDAKLNEVKPDKVDLIVKNTIKNDKRFDIAQNWIVGMGMFGFVCAMIGAYMIENYDPLPLFGEILVYSAAILTLPIALIIAAYGLFRFFGSFICAFEEGYNEEARRRK